MDNERDRVPIEIPRPPSFCWLLLVGWNQTCRVRIAHQPLLIAGAISESRRIILSFGDACGSTAIASRTPAECNVNRNERR